MSEFKSPCAGEAGLRVGRWLLGFGCACWGPGAARLPWEQKVLGAGGGGVCVGSGPFLAVANCEDRKSCGQNSQGNCGFTKPCHNSCCCPLLTEPYLPVMQVCCLLICQICWLRCKWIETDCRDFRIAKHTKAGTSFGYL